MKLKFKIIIYVLVLMFIAFAISGVFNSLFLTNEIKNLRKQQIENLFFNNFNSINQITNKMQANARAVSNAGESFYQLSLQNKDLKIESEIEFFLKKTLKNVPDILGTGIWYEPFKLGKEKKYIGPYAFWDKDTVKLTWEYNTKEYDYLNQGWYTIAVPQNWNKTQKREQDIYITSPYMDKLGADLVIFITMAGVMYDKEGNVLGVSSTDWSLDVIQNILKKVSITPESFVFLIDNKSGNILYHKEMDKLMKKYAEQDWGQNISLLSLKQNELKIETGKKIKDQNYDIYYAKNDLDFVFGIAVNTDEAYSIVQKVNKTNIIIISFIIIIAGIILYLLIHRVMQPLSHLAEVVAKFAKFDFKVRASLIKKDEVGSLAKTFNNMADEIQIYSEKLEEYNRDLENKITERTHEIREKNEELMQQKEELQVQAEILENANMELEKLSIIASETDNAIAIFNEKGTFEWFNPAFTRLYGYSIEEYQAKVSNNIFEASSNENIKNLIEKCVGTKKSVSYKSLNTSKNGKKIWAQTTITPIISYNGKIDKLIAIDSDITKMKEAEAELGEKNELLEFQNANINASIRYAQNIQQSFLPAFDEKQEIFEHFLIYKPKDIVSGDFYWHTVVNEKIKIKNEELNSNFDTDTFDSSHFTFHYFAVVDCTGHGVPGAFMSMLGNMLLKEIIIDKKTENPSDALTLLNLGIVNALQQEKTANIDGMDIILCKCFKNVNNCWEIIFSGAKLSLFHYKNLDNQIIEIRGDRHSIGGSSLLKHKMIFTDKNLVLSPNDNIYLSTDGFIDQNDDKRMRFGTDRFTELLKVISQNPFNQQKTLIENALQQYQGNESQRDDITFLGLKFR